MKIIYKKQDNYETPRYVVENIVEFLKPNSIILCPFDTGESEFVKVFQAYGHKVIHSHINDENTHTHTHTHMLIFLIIQKQILKL